MKRKISLLFGVVFAGIFCIGFSACNKPSENNKPSLPVSMREGHVEEYDGFTSYVHYVTNGVNGNKIYGRIFRPEAFDETKQYPAFIMSHGYNSTAEGENNLLVQNAVRHGMICYTYDFCGGGKLSKSEGKTTEMSVKTEISDLESVLSDIKELSYVIDSKIVLFGQSFGGLVTSLTAASNKDAVAALILQAPALSMVAGIHDAYATLDEVPETTDMNFMTVGKKYYEDMWNLEPYAEVGKFDKNLIILWGDQDTTLTVDNAEKAVNAYAEGQCTLYVVEGAEHSLKTKDYLTCIDTVNAYLTDMNIF